MQTHSHFGSFNHTQTVEMVVLKGIVCGWLRMMPKRFRLVRRQLEEMHMLMGSDALLLQGGTGHPRVGVKMRDTVKDGPMTSHSALDLWMDSMLSDVPESVICWHRNGVLCVAVPCMQLLLRS